MVIWMLPVFIFTITIAFWLPIAGKPRITTIKKHNEQARSSILNPITKGIYIEYTEFLPLVEKTLEFIRSENNVNYLSRGLRLGCRTGCTSGIIGLLLMIVNYVVNDYHSSFDAAIIIVSFLSVISIAFNLYIYDFICKHSDKL